MPPARLLLFPLAPLWLAGPATAAAAAPPAPQTRIAPMMQAVATGSFEVKTTPIGAPDDAIGVLALDKVFHGDLDGTGQGRMLGVRTAVAGSAGYVAMERVTATLAGRKGSFTLQHSGTMDHGTLSLSVTVVPDSGTDGLVGLSGTMAIAIDGADHRYSFRYALPATP